jgi:hypothetical protein
MAALKRMIIFEEKKLIRKVNGLSNLYALIRRCIPKARKKPDTREIIICLTHHII